MGLAQKGLELKEGSQQPLRTTGDDAHHLEEHDRDSPLRTVCMCVCKDGVFTDSTKRYPAPALQGVGGGGGTVSDAGEIVET